MFTIFPSIVREDIKMSPPITVIEVWDQDKVISNQSWGAEDDDCEISSDKTEDGNWYDAKKIGIFDAKNIVRPQVGKAEFLGRAVAKPKVFLQEDLVSVFLVPFSVINIMWIHPRISSYRRIFTKTWSKWLCYHQSQESYHPSYSLIMTYILTCCHIVVFSSISKHDHSIITGELPPT